MPDGGEDGYVRPAIKGENVNLRPVSGWSNSCEGERLVRGLCLINLWGATNYET